MKRFKKYSNRKIYSIDERAYVRLEDIFTLVKTGVDFQVVRHGCQTDVTSEVTRESIMRSDSISLDTLVGLVRRVENVNCITN